MCPRYLAQIKALGEYYDCGDALDAKKMTLNCPTKTKFNGLGTTDVNDIAKAKLYKANKKFCTIITLGQKTDHGLAVINKTKSDDFPQGLAYRVIEMLKAKNKPNDVTAELELRKDLDTIHFKNADDYYNEVVSVMARYDVKLNDTELIKIMTNKIMSTT